MRTITIPLDRLILGDRRREDMGDIDGLATSLQRFGLLHPVVIDNEDNLVAGGRRVAAARRLGWQSIDARLYGSLTLAERREIELEENIRRKDLTPYERSKKQVERAEVAAQIDRDEYRSESDHKSRGRPVSAGSDRRVAERLGIPKTEIVEARQHIEAVEKHGVDPAAPRAAALEQMDFAKAAERYPFIQQAPNLPRAAAVEMARTLDNAPAEKRDEMVSQAERWCEVQAELEPDRRADGEALQAAGTISMLAKFNTAASRHGAAFIAESISESPVPGPENSVAILRAAHTLIADILRGLEHPHIRRVQ